MENKRPISKHSLRSKAQKYFDEFRVRNLMSDMAENFEASDSWLSAFGEKYNIHLIKLPNKNRNWQNDTAEDALLDDEIINDILIIETNLSKVMIEPKQERADINDYIIIETSSPPLNQNDIHEKNTTQSFRNNNYREENIPIRSEIRKFSNSSEIRKFSNSITRESEYCNNSRETFDSREKNQSVSTNSRRSEVTGQQQLVNDRSHDEVTRQRQSSAVYVDSQRTMSKSLSVSHEEGALAFKSFCRYLKQFASTTDKDIAIIANIYTKTL